MTALRCGFGFILGWPTPILGPDADNPKILTCHLHAHKVKGKDRISAGVPFTFLVSVASWVAILSGQLLLAGYD